MKKLFESRVLPAAAARVPGRGPGCGTAYCRARRLRPPLRDSQDDAPVRLCPICGGEQYRWDMAGLRQGRLICAACLARKKEEDELI